MTSTPPFGRILSLGIVGRDVQAVKRALGRAAGTNDPALGSQTYGVNAAAAVRRFQRLEGLRPDGVYGPLTHLALGPAFDDYAYLLYTGHPPPSVATLQLPDTYHGTHHTAGMRPPWPGLDAIDMFADAGTRVLAPLAGVLTRCHMIDWSLSKRVGGWTTYLETTRGTYFLTHFGELVPEGTRVRQGQDIGSVGVVPHDWWRAHIHEGFKAAV